MTHTEIRQVFRHCNILSVLHHKVCYDDHLRKFPDFQRLASRFAAKKASLQDAYRSRIQPIKMLQLNILTSPPSGSTWLWSALIHSLVVCNLTRGTVYQLCRRTLSRTCRWGRSRRGSRSRREGALTDLQEAARDLENFAKMVETTLDMDEVANLDIS